jgi:hypothetical protein
MTLELTQRQPERPDWFDETHDSVVILEGRECEENQLISAPEGSYWIA